jgi:hypothetical protein
MTPRSRWLVVASVWFMLLPRLSYGGMLVPCSAPSMFPGTAVTVFVFPYVDHTSDESAKAESVVGTDLAGLIQTDTLLAISRLGNVAAIRLLGSPQQCQPARVLSDLIQAFGSNDSRNGIVMVWGRIFKIDNELYVQSYASFQRFRPKDPGEMIELPFGGSTLVGRLASQTIAFAPRHVSSADLEQIKARYAQANIVHDRPDETSPGKPLLTMFPNTQRPAYYLTETQGDWIRIRAQSGQDGWLLARAMVGDELLTSRLPEMKFVEGVAGYFAVRANPAEATAALASKALTTFEGGPSGGAADESRAVSKQLRGLIRLLAGHQSDAAFGDASALFAEAASLVPSNAAASNLAAVTALYRDWRNREATIDFEATANRFWESIGSDPTDQTALTNCWTLFNVARSAEFKQRFRFPDRIGSSELEAKAEAFKTVEVSGKSVALVQPKPIVPWPQPQ